MGGTIGVDVDVVVVVLTGEIFFVSDPGWGGWVLAS